MTSFFPASRPTTVMSALAVVAVLAVTPSAWAQSAQSNLGVSASVANNCTISTAPVSFGSYDPIVTHASTPLDATGTVTITCTKGTAAIIGLDAGTNAAQAVGTTRAMASSGNYLSYELYKPSGFTAVWGNSGADRHDPGAAPNKNARNFTVNGRIPAGQDVPAGAYADTVTATVNF